MLKRILFSLLLLISVQGFSAETANIKTIDFVQEGEISKLIIDLDKSVIAEKTFLKENGGQILVDIKNVKANQRLMRGIDTSEFSGSAVYISPYKKPGSNNDIRFAIQLRDNARSFLENKGTKLILHIENRFGVFSKKTIDKSKDKNFVNTITNRKQKVFVPKSTAIQDILENLTQAGVKRYVGRKISINVNEMKIDEVLRLISDTSGFNLITEDGVNKLEPLTISLVNLPWDEVLDTIMDIRNLIAYKHGNILTIDTEDRARIKRQKELDALNKNKTLEPLVTKILPVSYADLPEISKILTTYSTKERGSIQEDSRTRNLIIKDTVEVIERMKKILETLDTQTPQVLIEAKVVEASESYEFKAGLKDGIKIGYDPVTTTPSLPDNSGSVSFNSAPGIANSSILGASISVFKRLADVSFNLELMESESKGKIITSPKVVTENNKPASITDVIERSFAVNETDDETGVTTSELTRLTANISLNVTPKVTADGAIALKVDVTKSGFGTAEATGELPPTTSRSISTNVLVENGSTVVLGGLYQTDDQKIESGVPFLKDLPLIGWLFRSAYNPKKSRSELIVFLTPRIINQEEAGLINRELSSLGI